MSISELLPSVTALPNADKVQLVQLLVAQLAQEGGISVTPPTIVPFDPKQFFGVANESRQVIDDYLASTREDWL